MEENLRERAYRLSSELFEKARLKKGQILVVGCSSSEICGERIGTNSRPEIAEAVFSGIYRLCREKGIYLAAQCCEHLNRAIITEEEAVPQLDIVNVVPQPKAGGSFATAAWQSFQNPVAVEEIRADAGLDIGDTLIGMHLKRVAVPVRLAYRELGKAHVSAARVRPKFIGGERAHYNDALK
ncbi:TIGR01440 family protein [Oribacterium sp. oral taxon 078 str. F0262]|uniref:TIGR01440 family protein n=1 Tax=Oribacterium sp. oral taxon 078 TaxID=652706 RepID=UPI0001BCB9A3|nr:TIGR01440 family protein [Oribacterium sp. oral taxon 078]EFE92237.1 TIGR01440 family protein [Oribacterium sp. oral taxon 078 str. F0262]